MRAISLGWGVQSFTLAAMAAVGEIEADVAIHADTFWEKPATYAFVRQWAPWLEAHGLRVVTVGKPNQAVEKVSTTWTDIPAFTATNSRNGGQLRRQCTQRWKIEPIRRWWREELKRTGVRKTPGCIQSLQGISLDEFQRMRDSDVKWIVNEYPLVDLRMTRADCVAWLDRHGLEIPPKSACVFCPFQNLRSWHELKRTGGDGWNQAIAIDEAIRLVRPPFELFVHPSRVPLADAVRLPEDQGYEQLELMENGYEGCDSGYCFV